ncbi:hypothetical protein GCM10010428_55850 [Actinosynnema pretiosum subsp. pretiosum]
MLGHGCAPVGKSLLDVRGAAPDDAGAARREDERGEEDVEAGLEPAPSR